MLIWSLVNLCYFLLTGFCVCIYVPAGNLSYGIIDLFITVIALSSVAHLCTYMVVSLLYISSIYPLPYTRDDYPIRAY